MPPFDGPTAAPPSRPSGAALLGYIEDMLLELAHMAAQGGETALAATLAAAAIQAGSRVKAARRGACARAETGRRA